METKKFRKTDIPQTLYRLHRPLPHHYIREAYKWELRKVSSMVPSHKHNKHNCRFICNKVKIEKKKQPNIAMGLIPIHILELKFKINCTIQGNNSKKENSIEVWLFVHLVHFGRRMIFFSGAYCYIAAETLLQYTTCNPLRFFSKYSFHVYAVDEILSFNARLMHVVYTGVLWNGWHLNETKKKKNYKNIQHRLSFIHNKCCCMCHE